VKTQKFTSQLKPQLVDSHKGQALQGECLDLDLLDVRVQSWKDECGLFYQESFPPPNIDISEDGVKFHDRSHVLIQDYLGQTSKEFQNLFSETSLPPIYEEILTVFCARITHRHDEYASTKVSATQVSRDIELLAFLGYLTKDSDYLREKQTRSRIISNLLSSMVEQSDFDTFRKTLMQATIDCPAWNDLSLSILLKG
jgi:hypothetical protein